MMLEIPEDVAERLKALAKKSDVQIGDLLRDLLNRHESEESVEQKRRATAADQGRIAKEVARRYEALAKQRGADVGDVRRALLELLESDDCDDEAPLPTLADMARNANEFAKAIQRENREEGQQSTNTALNSREILKEIYAEKFGLSDR